MTHYSKTTQLFFALFLSTGIFAILGALYTWGAGPIWEQSNLLVVLIPWADIIITGPLSLLAAYGIIKQKIWGKVLGLMTCGMYLIGSALVYIWLIWEGPPYPVTLVLPPLAGIAIGISFPAWILRSQPLLLNHKRTESGPAHNAPALDSVLSDVLQPGTLNLDFAPVQEPDR